MKILHLISQHPESTGSGFYLQNIIRQATAAGHQNFLVAGISGNRLPQLDCISLQSCRFVHFDQDVLDYTIPGMSDVMPYPSSTFGTLSPVQLDAYEQAFGEVIEHAVGDFSPDLFFPPALYHNFGNDKESIQALLHDYGIRYVITRFSRARRFAAPHHEKITCECGVGLLERGPSPVPSNVSSSLSGCILLSF